MLDRGPRSFGPFRAVIRIFPGDAFAPPAHSIGLDAHQQDAAAVNPAKARFKKMHERHMNFTQRYRFDFHNELWFVSGHLFSDAINPSACRDGASRVSTKNRRPQPPNTARLRPTLPAGIAHSRVRRAHS